MIRDYQRPLKNLANWSSNNPKAIAINTLTNKISVANQGSNDVTPPPSRFLYSPALQVIAAAGSAIVTGAALRVLGRVWSNDLPLDKLRWGITSGIRNSYLDVALILVVMLSVLVLIGLASRRSGLARCLAHTFVGFTGVAVFLGWVNALALFRIGSPITFQWLYLGDMLRSYTSLSAIAHMFTFDAVMALVAALGAWFCLFRLALRLFSKMQHWRLRYWLVGLAFVSTCGYFALAIHRTAFYKVPEEHVANPLVILVSSTLAVARAGLFTVDDPIEPESLPPATSDPALLPAGLREQPIQNVLLVVMESVGSQYVAGTGQEEAKRWTPNIASYLSHSIVMPNIYAHVPYSSKSLYGLLTSHYPVISIEAETELFAKAPMLSQLLKDAGRRTAFFHSGDFQFQNVEEFLQGRGFDHLADMKSIPCNLPGMDVPWIHLDAVDDRCTADALINWIDEDPQKPFFGMFWTDNTHYPYLPGLGLIEPTSSDPDKDNYLAAVQTSDAAIGRILDHLRRQNRLDSTLVVIMGDHGEAFGEHDARIHGTNIYEEQIHIPLLLINPRLDGSKWPTVGGIIDIGPTILHVLGLRQEPDVDGRSLFDPHRSERVFLFSPNYRMMAGYREGQQKFIFDLVRGESALFDLERDPGEEHNAVDPETAALGKRRLAGWLAQQRRRNQSIISPEVRPGE